MSSKDARLSACLFGEGVETASLPMFVGLTLEASEAFPRRSPRLIAIAPGRANGPNRGTTAAHLIATVA